MPRKIDIETRNRQKAPPPSSSDPMNEPSTTTTTTKTIERENKINIKKIKKRNEQVQPTETRPIY